MFTYNFTVKFAFPFRLLALAGTSFAPLWPPAASDYLCVHDLFDFASDDLSESGSGLPFVGVDLVDSRDQGNDVDDLGIDGDNPYHGDSDVFVVGAGSGKAEVLEEEIAEQLVIDQDDRSPDGLGDILGEPRMVEGMTRGPCTLKTTVATGKRTRSHTC